jgi:NAD(P)-dependent dehydrogenase (short-subunit alcohol dehydrogenase family)
VVVSGRDPERGDNVVEEIQRDGGRAEFVAADLDGSPLASRELAVEATRILGGRVDVLVNNAGIFPPSPSSAATDEDTFDRIYAVNVKAPFFLTAAIAPEMAQHGNGSIINLGSWIARIGIPVSSVYSSSKGAPATNPYSCTAPSSTSMAAAPVSPSSRQAEAASSRLRSVGSV